MKTLLKTLGVSAVCVLHATASASTLGSFNAKQKGPEGVYSTQLKLDPTLLDFAGEHRLNEMYMPSSVELSSNKPQGITRNHFIGRIRNTA